MQRGFFFAWTLNKFGKVNIILYICIITLKQKIMAGHLPIATTAEHSNLLLELNKIKDIQSLPHFMSVKSNNGIFMNLPVKEYNMDEETGLKDEYVISFTPSHMEHILEIHLNSEGKINQVYLVL